MKIYPGATFTPVSEGVHPAVCCEFVDLGTVETPWGRKRKGMWIFQVAEREDDGHRKEIRCKFNLVVGTPDNPSTVQKLMSQWRGRAYGPADLREGAVDPEKPVGHACLLEVEHATVEDGKRVHFVERIRPAGEVRLAPEGYVPLAERVESASYDESDLDRGPTPPPMSGSPSSSSSPPSSPPPPNFL